MQRVVLDTNRLFAALRTRNKFFRELLFSEDYIFYSSKFIVVEIFKHKERIIKGTTTATEEEVYEYLDEVLQRIQFVNEDFVSLSNYAKAYRMCKEVDEKDTPFVALALQLNAQLWTKDEILKNHLKKKGFDDFFEP
jgi:predicted nucleic acid-binding protein